VGHKLLAKMGWKEGDSLGKTNAGILEPVSVQCNIATIINWYFSRVHCLSVSSVQCLWYFCLLQSSLTICAVYLPSQTSLKMHLLLSY